ncbi:tetratricopeptide repeat-containing diguanylate cyclase [Luteimonas huabeiensis]|uniref:tetratricopeptide repeat-containing diguanylate cyclase n=1 Tax=Luteimonas huabeiensis TaxID=1244513 RepID=UPI001267F658|nr:GGDEF domain-containing protein [Luteimonas huabeiensis]
MLVTLLALAPTAVANPSFDTLLDEAVSVRTSDVGRFRELLARLDELAAYATPAQRTHLRLLHAHRLVIGGDPQGAISLLEPIVSGGASSETRFEAGGLLANVFAITRQFEKALATLDRILPLQDEVARREVLHRGQLSAGIVYNQVGEFGLGLQFASRVLADRPDGRSRCIAENLSLESQLGRGGGFDREMAERAIRHCDAQKEPILAGFSRTYLARALHAQGSTSEAIELLAEYLQTVEDTGYPLLIAHYHALLAEYRMATGDREAARMHAEQAVSQTQTLALVSAEPLVIAFRTLYRLAEERADPKETLAAYRAFAEADRAHFSDVKSREMAYQIVRHQSQQQAQQIELLNQRNALLELERRVARQRARAWLALAVLLAGLLASIGYWALKTKRLQMRLKRMAETDMLTGVGNRHHFTQEAERLLAQCRREGRVAALLAFDLDHFKQVNDRFGHAAGDWALQQVAAACQALCGPDDLIARIGGEEFAILMVGRDAAAGRRVAEQALARLAAIDATSAGYDFRIGASFGVTDTCLSGYGLERMLSHADRAMYAAKRAGRNRVHQADGSASVLAVAGFAAGDPDDQPRPTPARSALAS